MQMEASTWNSLLSLSDTSLLVLRPATEQPLVQNSRQSYVQLTSNALQRGLQSKFFQFPFRQNSILILKRICWRAVERVQPIRRCSVRGFLICAKSKSKLTKSFKKTQTTKTLMLNYSELPLKEDSYYHSMVQMETTKYLAFFFNDAGFMYVPSMVFPSL